MREKLHIGKLEIPLSEVNFKAISSGGPGGQHVNRVASAIQLRFDILNSSLPAAVKVKLLQSRDSRISKKGILTIKASKNRSQSKNKERAISRLRAFIEQATKGRKKRIATKVSRAVQAQRKKDKQHKSDKKKMRRKPIAE